MVKMSEYGGGVIGRQDRFTLKSEFDFVRMNGRKYTSFCTLLIHAPCPESEDGVRYGVICSRKFDKRAVRRNRAKRLLHEAMRTLSSKVEMMPCRILLIPRREILKMKMDAVAGQLLYLMKKSGMTHWKGTSRNSS
ncbi:MAG: ribonuclease P protein component [Lentisphaeria bacterium]|nr:ribonuclease P protein component [Lentisphaeria bacterium]